MVHSDLFILDNVIRIILKVPSIRNLLSIRYFSGSLEIFINFSVVNFQIKSIVES